MIRFGLLFTLVIIVLWIFAIFDSITSDTAKVRNLQKPLWVIIVLLFGPILASGSIAWMIWGRPRVSPGGGGGGSWGGGGSGGRPTGPSSFGPRGGRTRSRPVAPDDDPDFLRTL